MGKFFLPLLLTTLAGLSTGVGSIISISFREINRKLLALLMGFSAGVMIYISFVEILSSSVAAIGFLKANIAFFTGMLVIAAVDFLIPHDYIEEIARRSRARDGKVFLAGIYIALGLAIHNFPEGMAVFTGSMKSTHIGISLAIAIALHNIPEGIAVAVPIRYATGSRIKGFWYSFLSGVAEPVGALFAMLIILPYLSDALLNVLLPSVAGIMIFISFDEILPITFKDSSPHIPIIGVVAGMALMACSLAIY